MKAPWVSSGFEWQAPLLVASVGVVLVFYWPLAIGILGLLLLAWANKYGLALPIVIILLPIRQVSIGTVGMAELRVGDVILAVVALMWLARRAIERRGPTLLSTRLELAVLGFVLLNALSVVWADDRAFAMLRAGKLLRNCVLYFLVVDYLARGFEKNLRRLTGAVFFAGWMVLGGFIYSIFLYGGLDAIQALFAAETLGSQAPELAVVRVEQGGTLLFEGMLNWTMMTVFLTVGMLPRLQGRRLLYGRRIVYLIAGGGALLLSLVRGAIVGFLVGALTLRLSFLRTLRRGHAALLVVALLVAASSVVSVGLPKVITRHFLALSTDLSMKVRSELWQRGVDAFTSAPLLGVGAGNVVPGQYIAVHNLYLQILAELGLLGGMFFAGLLFYWLGALVRMTRRLKQSPKNLVLARAVLAASVAYLIYGLVAQSMESMEPWILLGITTGLVCVNRSSVGSPKGFPSLSAGDSGGKINRPTTSRHLTSMTGLTQRP